MKRIRYLLILFSAALLCSCFIWGLTADRFMGFVRTEIPEYTVQRIAFQGRLAYMPCGEYGVKVIDFSDPLRPGQRGCLDLGVTVAATGLYNDRIVVSSDGNPRIVDVSDPDNLSELHVLTSVKPKHVLDGGYCYLYDDKSFDIYTAADIADGLPITSLGTYSSVQSGFDDLVVDGDYAYFQSEERVEVIDVSDRADPQWMGEYELPAAVSDIEGFYTLGDTLLLVDVNSLMETTHVYVVDVSDKSDPALVKTHTWEGYSNGTCLSGRYLLRAGGYDLEIYDGADPMSLEKVDTINLETYGWGVFAAGDFALVLETSGAGLYLIAPYN
jgi:hypothetical protein